MKPALVVMTAKADLEAKDASDKWQTDIQEQNPFCIYSYYKSVWNAFLHLKILNTHNIPVKKRKILPES
jgi:hypothetical protein